MVRTCIVEACGREYYPDCGLSFHRFPRDANVREMWIKVIPMSSTRKLTNASVVCSKHFKDQDYVTGLSRPVLKHDAVPSVSLLLATKKIRVLCDIQIPCSSKSDKFAQSLETPSKKPCIQQEFMNLPIEPLAKKFYQVKPKSNFKLKDASVQTDIKDPYSELLKQKIKILMQKLRRRDIQIKNLQDIKKRKCSNSDAVQTVFNNNFPDIKQINTDKSNKGIRYSAEMKQFALSLYYHSAKYYKFLRNHIVLPHPASLRKMVTTNERNVDLMSEVLEIVKCVVKE